MPSKEDFLEQVSAQIRCKRARGFLVRELADHIEDQAQACQAAGASGPDALERAVASMGDPVEVGQRLDRVHRPRPAWPVLAMVCLLAVSGIIIQYLLASTGGINCPPQMFPRHLAHLALGLVVMTAVYFLDYTRLERWLVPIYALFLLYPLFLMLNDRYRFSAFSPAMLFPPVYAAVIYRLRGRGLLGVLLCGAAFLPVCLALLFTTPITGVLIMTATCFLLLLICVAKNWFGGGRLSQLALVLLPPLPVIWRFCTMPGVQGRLRVFLHPELQPDGMGYLGVTTRWLLSGAQFSGPGLYPSGPPLEAALPGWANEFALTYLITRFGRIWGLVILLLVAVFLALLFWAALRLKNALGFSVSLACALTLAIQCALYISANLGIISGFSPQALPLLTYGLRVTVCNLALTGLLLCAYRGQEIVRETVSSGHGRLALPLVSFSGGRLVVDFNRLLRRIHH